MVVHARQRHNETVMVMPPGCFTIAAEKHIR
jgi:hypothetical protein